MCLDYDVQSGGSLLMFRRNLSHHQIVGILSKQRLRKQKLASYSLLAYHVVNPKNGDSTFLRNVGELLPGYMASHPRIW
jgi:hypothetical protein